MPVDGDTYDVPMQIGMVEKRIAGIYRRKFGDEATQKDLSPVAHVAKGKGIPPFLILHVADHPETKAQSRRLAKALQEAGVSARAFPAEGKNHTSINADLGLPEDKPTKALFEFVGSVLKTAARRPIAAALTCPVVALADPGECRGANAEPISTGILLARTDTSPLHEETVATVRSISPRVMGGTGLVGAMGGVRLKVLMTGTHEVLIPLPQLADAQIPVSYTIVPNPREAIVECRLRSRGDSNVVAHIRLNGNRDQEIEINWASVVFVARKADVGRLEFPKPYLTDTSCVQSDAKVIVKLADELWPASGKIDTFTREIQQFIARMQQKRPPRSMDALATLDSGANWICTANANLATALLRAKGCPARSIAVIPVISKRLEMHRIVEYFDDGRWASFDPSSLQKDIPTKPWQNIIVAKTTIGDEDAAMKPRPGPALGCPFGQEIEFVGNEKTLLGTPHVGMTLWGKDFLWTIATPLAEFEDDAEGVSLAKREWTRFLETGKLSQRQKRAAAARNANAFLDGLRAK